MRIIKTEIQGLLIIEPRVFSDERGYFFESYNDSEFKKFLPNVSFVQDNEAMSSIGVLRGLHFQTGEYAQAKLVRVVSGSVFDVAVDLRRHSPTYGKSFAIELNDTNKIMFFIPRGFAHGYVVLKENTIFQYKCDNYYAPHSESGILYNDAELDIDWKIDSALIKVSEKDKLNKPFMDIIPFENM